MVLKKHLVYWILPSAVILFSILLYFYDWASLSAFIAPPINREFGFIENLQLLIIAAIIFMVFKASARKKNFYEKYFFLATGIFASVVFLEEMDYGLHFYNYFMGIPFDTTTLEINGTHISNLHNIGKTTSILKLLVYIGMVLLFLIAPIIQKWLKPENKWFAYFCPSAWIILPLIAMFLLNQLALFLEITVEKSNFSLKSNVSEFEEVYIYYIGFLYLREQIKKNGQLLIVKRQEI